MGDVVVELEAAGHDIVWVRNVAPGSKDEDILSMRILVNLPGVQDCRHRLA